MPVHAQNEVWRRVCVGGFFGLLALLGWLVHDDYGVSTDEPAHYQHGAVNVKYIADLLVPDLARAQPNYARIPPLQGYLDNGHGVLFEIPVSLLGSLLAHGDSAAYYRLRHLLIFLGFMAGVWAVFRLAELRLRSWCWGLVAAGALVLSPRLFAEAFYNGQDVVFMSCFAIAMLTLARLAQHPTRGQVLLHSLACAVAIDVRIVGLLLIGFTLVWLAFLALQTTSASTKKQLLRYLGLFLGATSLFVVAGWPYLWESPLGHFLDAFQQMSRFPWQGRNFYLGELRPGVATPWHYLPVWIGITTPWPYLLAAFIGLFGWLKRLGSLRQQLSAWSGQFDVVLLAWLFGPLLIIIGLHATVYNAWRHLYFIYPALLLLAVFGTHQIHHWATQRANGHWVWRSVAGALLAGVLHTGYRMVQEHPQQQVYFSLLPSAVVSQQFDRDYWGLSYRTGLEWLLATDSAAHIRIGSPRTDLLINNTLILSAPQRQRLEIVRPPYTPGTYVFTNYARYGLQPSDTVGRKVYDLRVHGLPTLGIFKH
jgi:hypothetical protein